MYKFGSPNDHLGSAAQDSSTASDMPNQQPFIGPMPFAGFESLPEPPPFIGPMPFTGFGVEYLVHDGVVFCTKGTATTTMVATVNTEIGNDLAIIDTDTEPSNFASTFGECKARNLEPCEITNLPLWFEPNEDFKTEGRPTVKMDSFAVCVNGGGIIHPLEDNQSKEDIDADELRLRALATCESIREAIDPVNMSTGNFFFSKTEIEIPGQFPLAFKSYYNSLGESLDGTLGKNWTHNFNIYLEKDKDNRNVKITLGDGRVEDYYHRDDGSYTTAPDIKSTLEQFEKGYILTTQSKERHFFDIQGRLCRISDLNGNETVLQYYKANGHLGKVSNACGSLTLEYNDIESKLVKITDQTGRFATFEYDGNRLVSAINTEGAAYRYEYGDNGKITKRINPLGIVIVSNVFDSKSRVVSQVFADDGVAKVKYHNFNPYTILTEQNGNEIVYVHDKQLRTTRVAYKDGSQERFEYNNQNRRTKQTDRNGNPSTFVYDSHGNLTKETDPMGGVTAIAYNAFNKPAKITAPSGGVTEFEYDLKGNMIKTTDPLQRQLQFSHNGQGLPILATLPDNSENAVEYDERGNITAITDGTGVKTRYEHDGLNRVVKTINGEGHETLFEYTGKGDISKVTNPLGDIRRYEYNPSGKVTRITDFDNSEIQYSYNNIGKVEEIIDQAGGVTKFAYDLMWNVTSVTNPNGNTVNYVYDQYQRVIQTIDEEGNATSYEHDPKGNVTAAISPLGVRTEIEYDALDRQQKITEPDGAVTNLSYDKGGNLAVVTDALGNTTKREYDLAGQLIKLTDPLGNETKFTYSPLGQIQSITDANGGIMTRSYYPGGQMKSVTMPSGESESYEYDNNGNVIAVTDALGAKTELKYDQLDRVVETIDPLGHSKKFGYDALGNITSVTDEKGNITRYRYSLLGDVIEVIDAKGHSTKYNYDASRQLIKLEQFRMIDDPFATYAGAKRKEMQITTYEHNKKGEVVAVKSPLGKVVKYGYDSVGNMTSKLDEDGLETLYEYNLVNKLTKVSYADGKTVEFGYNALKQLTVMEDWLGITRIELDPLGRATKVTDAQGDEVAYRWNPLGQREKLVYPGGNEVGYEYDSSGRIKKVKSQEGVTNYSYDMMGRLKERILPDSTTTKYEVNPLGRLTGLVHSRDGDILDQFKYTYDPVGNIRQIEKQRAGMEADSGIFEYTYDPVGRLTSAVRGEQVKRYRYDELGNRVREWGGHKYDTADWTQHTFNARNQLVKTQEGEAVKEYRYDGRGNLTNISENGHVKSRFEFDATNMMSAAFTIGKGRAEYTYNGFRNRVGKLEDLSELGMVPDPTTGIIPDPVSEVRYTLDMTLPYDNLLVTKGGPGTKDQSFVWGNSLISASGEDKFYYLQDHLGSPIRLMGEGEADTPLAYDEFGVQVVQAGQNQQKLQQSFGFTGYMNDGISGLQYAQNRYYDPCTSRMISEDTHWHPGNMIFGDNPRSRVPNNLAIAQSTNLYAFCVNNPMRYLDPLGLCSEDESGNGPFSDFLTEVQSIDFLDIFMRASQGALEISSGIFNALMYLARNQPDTSTFSIGRAFATAFGVAAFGIGVGWNFHRDWQNPDISDERASSNALVNIGVGAGALGAGLLIAGPLGWGIGAAIFIVDATPAGNALRDRVYQFLTCPELYTRQFEQLLEKYGVTDLRGLMDIGELGF